MLYHWLYPLKEHFFALNLFRYITFRSALAVVISLMIFILFGNRFIAFVQDKTLNIRRRLTPFSHKKKDGTPSMGGIFIIFSVLISVLFTGNFSNPNIILCLVALVGFGIIGFVDDYIKEAKRDGRGIAGRFKFFAQIFLSAAIACYLYYLPSNSFIIPLHPSIDLKPSEITFPFFAHLTLDISYLYIPFAMLVIVGSSNAVNITDGLDGLAIGLSFFVLICFAVITYLSGHYKIAEYLKIPFSPQIGELTVFLAALCGACLGFLWFNAHPAQIFMGDTGSLSLGGLIGVATLLLKKELWLPIIGGVFVIETLSVIIQIGSFKWRKKRVFKMAPLHHHFELLGWHENKIITRFWILGAILALVGIASLKIR